MQVTAEQVQQLAREIFVNEKLNLAIVGAYTDVEVFKTYVKF